jgi:hypothetical protein
MRRESAPEGALADRLGGSIERKSTRSRVPLAAYPGAREAIGVSRLSARRVWRDWLARHGDDPEAALGALIHACGLDEPHRWLS